MLQAHNLSVSFGAEEILKQVSFSVAGGEIAALVGPNGAGKTTLLKCLVGYSTGHSGSVIGPPPPQIAYLPQAPDAAFVGTALERSLMYSGVLLRLHRAIQDGCYEQIEDYREQDGYLIEDRVRGFAGQFGIEHLLDAAYAVQSDGIRRKVDLVGTLASAADVLILDEPINFLDIRGITAFEDALGSAKALGRAVLMVSHDRELIDNVADRTLYLERGRVVVVQGGYTAALGHKQSPFASQVDRAEQIRRKIGQLQNAMRQRMGWAGNKEKQKSGAGSAKPTIAKQASKRMKRAKAIQRRIERKVEDLEQEKPWIEKEIALAFPPYGVDNRLVARLERVSKGYPGNRLFKDLDLALETRSRTAILGANGAGKSTLLNIITGNAQPDSGSCYRNASVSIGHLTQGLAGFYSEKVFLHNFVDTGYEESQIRQFLGAAKLRKDKVLQPVETLSFGERVRGAVVKMILLQAEYLVLDEPTTHLDIESVEVLEELLQGFPGGFVMVSHDRRLVSSIADEVRVLSDGVLARL